MTVLLHCKANTTAFFSFLSLLEICTELLIFEKPPLYVNAFVMNIASCSAYEHPWDLLKVIAGNRASYSECCKIQSRVIKIGLIYGI
jgi:hypothetical protein